MKLISIAIVILLISGIQVNGQSKDLTFHWKLYEGSYDNLPDFARLTPTQQGSSDSIKLGIDTTCLSCAVILQNNIKVNKTANYKILVDGRKGNVLIDGKELFRFDRDGMKERSCIVELLPGNHVISIQYIGGKKIKPFQASIKPYHLLVNENRFSKEQSQYFGWIEDHPKAISLMGGALYPRRPRMISGDDIGWKYSKKPWHASSDQPIVFLLSVDGSAPYYPDEKAADRRRTINWTLAEGYLPSPVSKWVKDSVEITIQHFGSRLLNNTVNAVYTRVLIKNMGKRNQITTLLVNGENVNARMFVLNRNKFIVKSNHLMDTKKNLSAGQTVVFDFVTGANGSSSKEALIKQGGFDANFSLFRNQIDSTFSKLTYPESLPDKRLIALWKTTMTGMWNATVKTPDNFEQRGSGGNVFGWYQYDRVFDHDVPDMTHQYILEGNWDVARQIMTGSTYEGLSKGLLSNENYLDAVPKYVMTMALYLQITGDTKFFDQSRIQKIKHCAKAIKKLTENQPHGLVKKSSTLDNGSNQLVVDNFAVLHGYTAYKYIFNRMNDPAEVKWVQEQIDTLTYNLNKALDISMKSNKSDWYNACFSFDNNERLISGPGNWFGTTLMMSTFPWNAYLKGFNLGGTWKDHFDPSITEALNQSKKIGNPDGSLGAWWNAKYGTAYNAGMALQMLYSDKYRTQVVGSIQWLLDNQSVPHQWGESFHAPTSPGDWTKPETDYETWALGFIRQAMLESCISLKANGNVILGRGIPDQWMNDVTPIIWKNVHFNDGKMGEIRFSRKEKKIIIDITGEVIAGNFEVDIPYCKRNIQSANATGGKIVSTDPATGKVVSSGSSRKIEILLQH
jgi:hypothetical protein